MRTLFAVTVVLALFAGAAWAGESDSETEVEHPVLPGLGSPCYPLPVKNDNWRVRKVPKLFGGVCKTESACGASAQEHGYCAGLNVVCCMNPTAAAPEPVPWVEADEVVSQAAVPPRVVTLNNAQSAASPLVLKSTSTALNTLVKIPAGINPGLNMASASTLLAKIGKPGCPLTAACFSCTCAVTNPVMIRNRVTMQVAPNVKITGLKPYVEAVKRAFDAMAVAGRTNPAILQAYNTVKTAGGLCCRPIKRANGTPGSTWSNHSWGVAADFYFGANMDPRGDGKTQYGLLLMAPFFAKEKLYWAAGYGGSQEDAMHFEASREVLAQWKF